MPRRLIRIAVVLAAAVLFAGSVFTGSVFAATTIRLGHAMPDSHPQAAAMIRFAELVKEYSGDALAVQIYHDARIGSDEKMIRSVQSGTQEIYIGTLSSCAARVKEVRIWDIPFAFADDEELYAIMKGPSARKILEKMEAIGVRGLTWAGIGFRSVSNNKRAVEKLEDIAGLKLRVMTNPIARETWKTLGADAVPMAFAEVFTALETRTIDGQESPLRHMFANKMQKVQKFISLTNHVHTAVGMIASRKWWDGLAPDLQAAVQKAATEAAALENELIRENDKSVIKQFEAAGVKVNSIKPEELARIREKIKPVSEKFRDIVGEDFYKAFYAELDAIRARQK